MGGTHSTTKEKASSISAATSRSRLVAQPRAPGQREEDRQAKAFAVWAKTTVMKAAPDAAARSWPVGNGSPGRQPSAIRDTTKATRVRTASSGPSTLKARRSTVLSISRPRTGGPSRMCLAGGSAPSATADRVSVPRSSAMICRTPSARGNWPPESAQTTNGVSSATLSVRW